MYSLLCIFSFGTIKEYQQHASSLPPLSVESRYKLLLLTLVSMASTQNTLDMNVLERELGLNSIQVHELVMDALGLKLIKGKINSQTKSFVISECIGRGIQDDAHISRLHQDIIHIQSLCINLDSYLHQLLGEISTQSLENSNLKIQRETARQAHRESQRESQINAKQ